MRDIKFRAYHTEQKRMFDVYCLGIDLVAEITYNGVDYGNNVFCGDDVNFIKIMQYTGLKDKNGKEIYEGYLLEMRNELGYHKIFQIFYKDGGLCFNTHFDDFNKNPNEIYFYESCADMQSKGFIVQCEIIGNIYENPELLNE